MTTLEAPQKEPPDQPYAPQFSLRSVLLVIAAVAVVCAIAAPWIRAWPWERQLRLLGVLASAMLGMVAGAALPCVTFTLSERQGGHTAWCPQRLLIIPKGATRWMYVGIGLFVGFWIFSVVACISIAVGPAQANDPSGLESLRFHGMPAMNAATASMAITTTLMTLSTTGRVRLCRHGVWTGSAPFHLWHAIKKHTWTHDASGKWHTVHFWLGQSVVDVKVPGAMHQQVDRILAEHVGRPEENPWSESG